MRLALCDALVKRSATKEFVFLTGDLGFQALEPLQRVLKDRFINSGISEQNMISVAAGLAKEGLEVWVYSIAPFIYARAFEQIRNDITFHALPVNLIGNGGGYGYGVMGPTHHALEDYGVLSTLQKFHILLPAMNNDLFDLINYAPRINAPTYLRLGKSEFEDESLISNFSPWRSLTQGGGPVVITVGPLGGLYYKHFKGLNWESRPNLWMISEFCFHNFVLPIEIKSQISNSSTLYIFEEHVLQGSIGRAIAYKLFLEGIHVKNFIHKVAKNHVYDLYGSQNYLRGLSELDLESAIVTLEGH